MAILLYLVFRPFVAGRAARRGARAQRAREIVRAYGERHARLLRAAPRTRATSSPPTGSSLIAYAYVRGYAMVAADPIGPPRIAARTLDEFLAFCRERGWRVAFLAVREADAPLYRERGMHALYLGDEAILRCDTLHARRAAR